jgi:hypothetical protein
LLGAEVEKGSDLGPYQAAEEMCIDFTHGDFCQQVFLEGEMMREKKLDESEGIRVHMRWMKEERNPKNK